MEFDESRVYTAINADKLKVGSMVIVSDTLKELKERVAKDTQPYELVNVRGEEVMDRFDIGHRFRCFAYLVEEAPKLKWTDLKIGDVIRDLKEGITRMVTVIDSEGVDFHIYAGDIWIENEVLSHFEKVQ